MGQIHLDDCDFVIGLNPLDRINDFSVLFVDCIYILDPYQQCVMSVNRNVSVEIKMLFTIQLAKGILNDENIDLIVLNVGETPLKVLKV